MLVRIWFKDVETITKTSFTDALKYNNTTCSTSVDWKAGFNLQKADISIILTFLSIEI